MNTRGAIAALVAGGIALGVAFGTLSGPQAFSKIYADSPIAGDGRGSGSSLSAKLNYEDGDYGDCSDGDVTVNAPTVISYSIVKNVHSNGWNTAGASSQLVSGDMYVEWTPVPSTEPEGVAFGLSATDPDQDYATIAYALYPRFAGLQVIELGTIINVGPYASGDVLRVQRTGSTVTYYSNGTLVYTSLIPSTGPLLIDSALYYFDGWTLGGITLHVGGVFTLVTWGNVVAVAITTNRTPIPVLTRDTYYHDLTIGSGATVNTGGYKLYVCDALTFADSSGRIGRDGSPGGDAGGCVSFFPSQPGGTLPGAGAGTTSGHGMNPGPPRCSTTRIAGGASATNGVNGGVLQGGTGGGGVGNGCCTSSEGGGGVDGCVVTDDSDPRAPDVGYRMHRFDTNPWDEAGWGGCGGEGLVGGFPGSTDQGGGQGGGGPWVFVAARKIFGDGWITSRGGAGGIGVCNTSTGGHGGGGGGGPGGIVTLWTATSSFTHVDVSGGVGGTGVAVLCTNSSGHGGDGGPGLVYPHYTEAP